MTDPAETPNELAALAARFINNTGRHIFLTGKAGTGKTTFLKYITRHTHKNVAIAAPTGIAAINAGGVTLHSLFQLPFGGFVPSNQIFQSLPENIKLNTPSGLIGNQQIRGEKRSILRELELLIIDEVSMLRADLLDAIDLTLRNVRRQTHLPFGGLQILFIGDLLQLPPVVKEEEWNILKNWYKSPYFFDALALEHAKPLYIEFDKIYRQQDDGFIRILNNLRTNEITQEDIDLLNQHYEPGFKVGTNDGSIYLTTHNHKADTINKDALQKLKSESFYFKADIEGKFSEYAYPVEPTLELKKDAQVMFIKNDSSGEKRYFNGKIGTVSDIGKDYIKVMLDNSPEPIEVERHTWENVSYGLNEVTNEVEEQVIGHFMQYPIRLAWAITIHKSQGLTFQKAVIDIGEAFVSGQAYVALSRLVSLEGLTLAAPIRFNGLIPDVSITDYANNKLPEDKISKVLEAESLSFLKDYLISCFNFSELANKLRYHQESYDKAEEKSAKTKYRAWAIDLQRKFGDTKDVAVKFISQISRIIDAGQVDYKEQLQARVSSAKDYFMPQLKQFIKEIVRHKESVRIEKRMKTYVSELSELENLFYKQVQLVSKAESMVQSAAKNAEYLKENVNADKENEERIKEMNTVAEVPEFSRGRKPRDREKSKQNREVTKLTSLDMYKSGKTISEIATERGYAYSTIEGHLVHFVRLGELAATQFVDEQKIAQIRTAADTLENPYASAIKQILGDEFSYGDIKFAMAEYKREKGVDLP